MLKHVVFYRLNEKGFANIGKITENFLSMRGKIDGLLSVECGADVLRDARSFDYALICTFTDVAALKTYKTHPVHIPVKEYMHTVITESKSCDFEF